MPWGLSVLLLIAAVAFAVLWLGSGGEEERRDEVRERASEFALALTNFSSQTIEADVDEIRSFATGDFAVEVEELFSPEVISSIQEIDAESTATLEAVFVQTLGDVQSSAFAVLRQSITNENTEGERSDIVRMEIAMVHTEDEWKVERVELFQSPGAGLSPVPEE